MGQEFRGHETGRACRREACHGLGRAVEYCGKPGGASAASRRSGWFAELRDTRHRWDAFTGDDPTMDVRTVFSWSYQALTPPAARLLRLLSPHPGPDLTAPAAASLAGVSPSEVGQVLAELIRASLLVEHTLGRYAFHDLLRAYATDLTQAIDPARSAKRPFIACLTTTCTPPTSPNGSFIRPESQLPLPTSVRVTPKKLH